MGQQAADVESGAVQLADEAPGADSAEPRRLLLTVRSLAIVAIAVAVFLALSLKNITLPGLYYDEALDVVPAMQLLQGTPIEPVRGAALTMAGRALPLMVMDYVGAVNTYLALPVFAAFGVSTTSVRLLPILLAALTLALAYCLAARLFDWRVAAVTVLLAAVDPSYIFFSRMGIHVTSVMTVFALGSTLAFLRWHDSGRARWLVLGGLLLGLGLWAKVLFLWWIVALGVAGAAALLVGRRARTQGTETAPVAHIDARGAAGVAIGLLAGSAPLWLYNLMTGGTLATLGRNALVTEHGVSNLSVLSNLVAAVRSFGVLLDGRYFWFLGGQYANVVNVAAFALACVGGGVLIGRRAEWRTAFVWAVGTIALIVAASAITVSGIWATHLYVLLPLPQMVMALFIVLAADAAGGALFRSVPSGRNARKTVAAVITVLALGGMMLANYQTYNTYQAALERSGGLSRFSDAIYKLASWLDERKYPTVYAVDWGIQKNVQILTQGRVNPIEISGYAGEPEEAFVRRAEQALADPASVYILHSKEDTVYELYPAFKATAERLGYTLKIIDATRDRSGAPVHVMWIRE